MEAKNVLIVGATGHVGQHLPAAVQERGMRAHALVRPETMRSEDPAKKALVQALVDGGVVIHEGSLEDADSLLRACSAVQYVVSAVGGMQLGEQTKLIDAIRRAGTVERFIPSEFGGDVNAVEPGECLLYDMKRGIQEATRAAGLPATYVYTNGLTTHWTIGLGYLGLTAPPEERVRVYGGGDVNAYLLEPVDAARVVARTLDDPRTLDQEVAVMPAQNLVCQEDLVRHWETRCGVQLERDHFSAEDVTKTLGDLAGRADKIFDTIILQLAKLLWLDGSTTRRREGVLEATELYPDMTFAPVTGLLDSLAAELIRRRELAAPDAPEHPAP